MAERKSRAKPKVAEGSFRARVGLDYPGPDGKPRRAEPGRIVADLPAGSVKWLLEQGLIVEVES